MVGLYGRASSRECRVLMNAASIGLFCAVARLLAYGSMVRALCSYQEALAISPRLFSNVKLLYSQPMKAEAITRVVGMTIQSPFLASVFLQYSRVKNRQTPPAPC